MYSEKVWNYFNQPANMGRIVTPTAIGRSGSAIAGNFIEFTATIESGIISDIRFQTFGCAPAIATGSLITELLKCRRIDVAERLTAQEVLNELGGLPSDKEYCVDLAINAIKILIEEYKSRDAAFR